MGSLEIFKDTGSHLWVDIEITWEKRPASQFCAGISDVCFSSQRAPPGGDDHILQLVLRARSICAVIKMTALGVNILSQYMHTLRLIDS